MTVLFEAAPVGHPSRDKMLTMSYLHMQDGDAIISVQVHDSDANIYIETKTSMNALILNGMPSSGFVEADNMVECLDKALFHEKEWNQKRPKIIIAEEKPVPEGKAKK